LIATVGHLLLVSSGEIGRHFRGGWGRYREGWIAVGGGEVVCCVKGSSLVGAGIKLEGRTSSV
jgi:hypothetical protein